VKIVVLGASGLIGSALVARLRADGHQVVAVSRRPRPVPAGGVATVACAIGPATPAARWEHVLRGADALVNCAGTLQDAPGESTSGVHADGLEAVFAACETVGLRRVVHISALGVERRATPFSRSKLAGEQRLMQRDLDWVILRPSVVVGRAAYGGSALLRGLASLPILPVMEPCTSMTSSTRSSMCCARTHAPGSRSSSSGPAPGHSPMRLRSSAPGSGGGRPGGSTFRAGSRRWSIGWVMR
jgi:uncharacterized protein YbjT (DUF2867 family)